MQIRIYEDYKHTKAIAYTEPINNLTIKDARPYENDGGDIGLVRIEHGQFKGRLAIIYYNELYIECGFGELIDECEAFDLCFERGKPWLIDKLKIDPNADLENHIVECYF